MSLKEPSSKEEILLARVFSDPTFAAYAEEYAMRLMLLHAIRLEREACAEVADEESEDLARRIRGR